MSFGIGIICWLLLGSILLNRLFFRPSLPAALVPTLAIEAAPPAVAGGAYYAITSGAEAAAASVRCALCASDGSGTTPILAGLCATPIRARVLGLHVLVLRRRNRHVAVDRTRP